MVRSMYSGVSGLKSHQTRMDVIGNNIANVNTYGFKAGRVTFRDVYYQTLNTATGPTSGAKPSGGVNPNQIGYGTSVGSIDTLHTRSGFQFTDNGFDVAIAGEGYFQVQDPDGNRFFTRAGILNIDPAGNVVDANGYFVLGENSNIVTAPVPAKSGTVGFAYGGATLLATATPPSKETNNLTISVTYDGTAGSTTKAEWTGNSYTVTLGADADADSDGKISKAEFDARIAAMTTTGTPPTTGTPAQNIRVNFTFDGAVQELTVAQLTGTGATAKGVTKGGSDLTTGVQSDMYATAGNPASGSKPAGIAPINVLTLLNQSLAGMPGFTGPIGKNELTGVGISKDGTIMAKHATYGDLVLGRIDLSTFANPNGLTQAGNNYYTESANSGVPNAATPGRDGSGDLVAGALEMSNVDLSAQFTDMIVTQRGFQANSRVITTTDEMLAELINLKR